MIEDDLVVAGQSADEQPPIVESEEQKQPREPDGKFAGKKADEPKPEAQEAVPKEEGKNIPIQALDAEKARRRKLEQELYQLKGYLQAQQSQPKPAVPQEPAKPLPDWYLDPQAAFKANLELELAAREQKRQPELSPRQILEVTSRQIALSQHGQGAVQTAYEAANEAMSANPVVNAMLKARLEASEHPFGELIKWHKEQSALSRVGDDSDAYIEAEVQRRLAEAGVQSPAGQAQPRVPVLPQTLPSNFANARNQGNARQPAYGGPKPLNEIYGGR